MFELLRSDDIFNEKNVQLKFIVISSILNKFFFHLK